MLQLETVVEVKTLEIPYVKLYDARIYFCLFNSEWRLATDDLLTMWHVRSGPSTPEVPC